MKILYMIISAALIGSIAEADTIQVNKFKYVGPVPMPKPVVVGDTSKLAYDPMEFTIAKMPASAISLTIDEIAPKSDKTRAMNFLSFDFENRSFGTAELSVSGLDNYEVSVDNNKYSGGKLKLHPGTHKAIVKYISQPGEADSISVKLISEKDGLVNLVDDNSRMITLDDIMCGGKVSFARISPSGKYVCVAIADVNAKGASSYRYQIYDAKTGKMLSSPAYFENWMPRTDKYYITRNIYDQGRCIVGIDPITQEETIIADHIPSGYFYMSPTEDYLVYSLTREGQKEDADIYQVLEPEDRIPGWRDRTYPAIYDLNGPGMLLPVSTGSDNCMLSDISKDGKKLLLSTMKSRLERRPTTVGSLIVLDKETFEADTLYCDEGFVSSACFSPDASQVLVSGTPEAFNRIGCVLPDSVIPSMTQSALFVIDVASKDITPISRDFNPNPQDFVWNEDGCIYVRSEHRDGIVLHKYDPMKGVYSEIKLPEDIVFSFDIASKSPMLAWYGQSVSNPDRAYVTDLKTGKHTMLAAPSNDRLSNVRLAQVHDWNFVNQRGDTIYGRYYLPDNFDPEKKYPLIVNYYGGCSPSERYFESRYPFHVYSELGYVVYVVQPSGATGFGQEFSSRHVNTAGEGPAQDIIEGTQKFVAEHPFVNVDKIGCIGASYGGFMTQYLQTITDIFAAAISHAGISDHTSYWGEGYWGYSYSEVSMANSYPWTRKDLFVDRSPLYNADKVNTPILFLHGDSDTNVPVGESIQMFAALKLLGKDAALVQVKGQDHHIKDFGKRRKWQDTIFAWFAKYLQDDPDWWNEMYPDKGL